MELGDGGYNPNLRPQAIEATFQFFKAHVRVSGVNEAGCALLALRNYSWLPVITVV